MLSLKITDTAGDGRDVVGFPLSDLSSVIKDPAAATTLELHVARHDIGSSKGSFLNFWPFPFLLIDINSFFEETRIESPKIAHISGELFEAEYVNRVFISLFLIR